MESKKDMRQAFAWLHLSVVLAGFTGLFGKLITLNGTECSSRRSY